MIVHKLTCCDMLLMRLVIICLLLCTSKSVRYTYSLVYQNDLVLLEQVYRKLT